MSPTLLGLTICDGYLQQHAVQETISDLSKGAGGGGNGGSSVGGGLGGSRSSSGGGSLGGFGGGAAQDLKVGWEKISNLEE